MELGDKFGDEWEGVSILHSYGIQCMVVLDQPEWTIFFLNEEHRGYYGGFRRSDLSSMQVFLQEGVQLSLFQWEQGIDFWWLRLCSGDQFNSVIPFVVLGQYVKVLFSKHGSELCDVGGQQSGSGKCLLTVSSSFHKMLGGHSGGLEVSLGKLWKEAYKEQLVFKLLIGAICLQRHFFKV